MLSAVRFLLLVFAGSWALWFAASAARLGPWAFLPGTIMPALVVLWLVGREEGPGARRNLAAQAIAWRVNAGWYLFALLFMATVKLAAAAAHKLVSGVWPTIVFLPVIMLLGTLVSTPVQAGEEIGWRAYLLPRMGERLGLRLASLLVGLIWAAWHLPMFYLAGADMVAQSFPVFALGVTALSVAITWLYARTGSLLLAMLLHAAIDNTTGIVPGASLAANGVFSWSASFIGWATILILWFCAIIFLATMPTAIARPAGAGSGRSR
jgi:membrane protease YdiL (CAAX protease family)